jgi:CubicO group peptidase (beta-lactamase class C family)
VTVLSPQCAARLGLVLCLLAGLLPRAGWSAAADAQLEGFVDGVLAGALARRETVGATVAVVQGGSRLLLKGYGYANAEQQVPVDPLTTLFRVGSISKVPVWMTMLQLAEQGVLSLDDPVKDHLQTVVLEDRFPAPILIRQLMTHSSGFEDRVYGLFTDGSARVPPLADYLAQNAPRQLFRPGSTAAYSNYGTALAARVVENATESPFEAHVQGAIFEPLGISAIYRQSDTEVFRDRLAQAYRYDGDEPVRLGIEYVVPAPAGALSATADDLARLMIELLDPNPSAVLGREGKRGLLERAVSVDPKMNGRTLGLYEMTLRDGVRAVGHGGDTVAFHSRMVLWPTQRLGLFISTNTVGGERVVGDLVRAFAAHYQLDGSAGGAVVTEELSGVAGTYGPSRREETGPFKLLALLSQISLSADVDRELLYLDGLEDRLQLEPRGNGLFDGRYEPLRLKYQAGADGPDRVTLSAAPVETFARVPWYDEAPLNLLFLGVVALLNLCALLRLPYQALRARLSVGPAGYRGSSLASLLFWLVALLILALPVALVTVSGDTHQFMLTTHRQLGTVLWLPVAIALGVVLQLFAMVNGWRLGRWWPGRRWFLTLLVLANGCLVIWFYRWNLQPLSVAHVG